MKDRIIALLNQVIDILKDFSNIEIIGKIIDMLKGFIPAEEKPADEAAE